ncbi:DNA-binding protein [Corynebacterium ulcerans]|uniref:DNA-binding protein n=1 Tax=Corynebacterium ulcerans TaxID=65058 RepID=UPI0034A1C4B4
MNFEQWLQSLPGSPSPTTAARKAGLVNVTLLRHAEKGETTADNIIAIARAYGIPPVDALVTTGHLRPDEIGGERTSIKMALKRASIGEKWDSIAEDIDGMHLIVGRFPRIHELDITAITDHSSEESEGESELERRRKAKSGPTPPVETTAEAGNEAEELDYDALIERINAGTEQVAAQKRTPPLEEHFT